MLVFSIKDIYENLKTTVENNFTFVIVRGYVSSYNTDGNNNLYLTLQDNSLETDSVTIQCCCWNSRRTKLKINIEKDNIFNKEIIVKGYISVYKKPVSIKLIAFDIILDTKSNIQSLQYKKEQYFRELGYFNEERKKPLPTWPSLVGLITSKHGDAYTDFITCLQQRFCTKILFYNTPTQGHASASEITKAINYFNSLPNTHKPKVIVITRGGGSFEDLQSFNDESLIQAIYESNIPIVTAIGHTNDICCADYAADKYTSTPTKAAEIVAPITVSSYKNQLNNIIKILNKELVDKLNYYKIQKELINTKMPDHVKILNNMQFKVNELHKITQLVIKECYYKYTKALKDIHDQLECFSTNSVKNKAKMLITIHNSLINKASFCWQNHNNNFQLLKNIFMSIPFNIQDNKKQLVFIKNTLKNQTTLLVKEKSNNYHFLNKALNSLSYKSTLKRGYAIIKENNSENIITRGSNLENKHNFDIVFYDKTIKIHKK